MNNSLVKTQNNVVGAVNQVGGNSANVVVSAEATKELAQIQGKVYMAKTYPRDITLVENKIQASCERLSLAEVAEFEYPKGGQVIRGASIKLLETIAQCYGNLHYTWKEIHRDNVTHKSTCIAEAWDLENNISSTLEFEVSHYRDKKGGAELITAERDIYEHVASQAVRRMRKCLESVIPRDLVDQAREWCNETITKKVDVQKGIDKAIQYFEENYKVSLKQIEAYFGMSRQAFNKNQYVKLQKLYTSIKDGVATVDEIFPKEVKAANVSSGSILKEQAKDTTNDEVAKQFEGEI